MNRVRIELVPAIGRSLVGLGIGALFGGTHHLRRLAEDFVWGDHCNHTRHGGQCATCAQVHHHYRRHCQPRCHDCRC